LEVIAEVEDLSKTLARFPGMSDAELRAQLRGRGKQMSLFDAPARPAAPARTAAPAAKPRAAVALRLWTDGASRGNPGPASIGVLIEDGRGERVAEISTPIGVRTNNFAEYEAVRSGLARALELGAEKVTVHADSELVVRQLNGDYRVKSADLLPLYSAVKALESKFSRGVAYKHVPREQNAEADRLANLALDNSGDKA
jgi:ribonuclease HI